MSKNKIALLALLLALLLIAGLVKITRSQAGPDSSENVTYKVKRGPLRISVVESGTIKPREQIIIKNEVEGRTSIIYLIPEGTLVKKGELLVQLDASTLEDNRVDQEIRVQNAEASFVNATENLAVVENQAKSDQDLATLDLEFAKQDLQKYLEGEYPNELQKMETQITLAEEELTRARETLKWSQTLYDEKYISQTELQADQLSEKKKTLDLELARNNLKLLTEFTRQRQVAQLESDLSQAEMAMERTTRKARANVVQAQADLKAKQAEYNRQKDKLEKIEDQINKTRIHAPADGLVIYSTSAQRGWRGNDEPLQEGQDVRERQELIYLPTASASKAEITIHESNLEKIKLGLPAIVTVDAVPGSTFPGYVAQIAPLPDAQSMWMNPDLKVYNTEIFLESNGTQLRTGMSCQAEMIIEQYSDAFFVPIQAVLLVDGKPTVYVQQGKNYIPRTVQAGMDNNKMIHILSGLEEGEVVLLTPPLKAAEKTDAQNELQPVRNIQQIPNRGEIDTNVQPKPIEDTQQEPSDQAEPQPQPQSQPQPPRLDQMTPEQREEMRKRFEQMTPEQKEEMRKRFENRPPQDGQRRRRQNRSAEPAPQGP